MFSSVNENNVGFSAVGQEELEKVNGGGILLTLGGVAVPPVVFGLAVALTVAAVVSRRKR